MNVPRTAARASSAVSSWWCSARRRTVFRAAVRVIRGSENRYRSRKLRARFLSCAVLDT
jgi:hypothetical protein